MPTLSEKFRTVRADLPADCCIDRLEGEDFLLTSEWGVGLYFSKFGVSVRSGCCGDPLNTHAGPYMECWSCKRPSPLRSNLKLDHAFWPDAVPWFEEVLQHAGFDVLDATIRASVLLDLERLVH